MFLLLAVMLAAAPAWGRKVALVVIAPPSIATSLREAAARAIHVPDVLMPEAPALAPEAEITEQRLALLGARADALVILRAGEVADGIQLTVRALASDRVSDRHALELSERAGAGTTELVTQCLRDVLDPTTVEAPPAAAVVSPGVVGAPPPSPPPPPAPPRKRRHPYGLLVAGAVGFLLPYLATVGVGAYYKDYNPNASRVGYLPLAGPFLARNRMSDKDLGDGFGPGLITDGVLQAATFGMLVSGILWCAIGEKARGAEHATRPILGVSTQQAMAGVQVSF